MSLVVEPSYLATVSELTFGPHSTSETAALVQRARSRDPQFYIASRHGRPLLFRRDQSGRHQLVIPDGQGVRQLLLEELHCGNLAGHLGANKLIEALL